MLAPFLFFLLASLVAFMGCVVTRHTARWDLLTIGGLCGCVAASLLFLH